MDIKELEQQWREHVSALVTGSDKSYEQIARECGCTLSTVYGLARKLGVRRKADAKQTTEVSND